MTLKTKLLTVIAALLPVASFANPNDPISTVDAKNLPRLASAVPGDRLDSVDMAVPSPSGIGIGIAVDCNSPATMYYTNSYDTMLYSMTTAGVHIGSVRMFDVATNAPKSFGAISYDLSRQKLWGGTDMSGNPLSVYLIDPVTGSCTNMFTMAVAGCCGFCDGIAIDDNGQTIWVSDDIATYIEHWDVSGAPFLIGTLYPDSSGNTIGNISGIAIGKGDRLYLGRDGLSKITAVTKSTGAFISEFATTYGRVEGLTCDLVTFAPKEVLWSKDAYGDFVEAFEVESGTCVCGGVERIPTLTEWGMITFCVLLFGWMAWVIVRRRKRVTIRA